MARLVRSVSWVVMGYGVSQALRLASNLILTRILFPEAFGLMALITMVVVGLALFSDIGFGPAVAQSKRGDDPDFLNTAWTLQVFRGLILCGAAWALAPAVARFYDEPLLAEYIPIASLSLLIAGLNPTRIATAHRHLYMGRLMALELAAQCLTLLFVIAIAWYSRSVFALVLGSVVQASLLLLFTHLSLPGHRNRFHLDMAAVYELIGFGKWILLSTACAFVYAQGDKALLGKYLSLESLGIYNIGFFLASFPLALGTQVASRLLISVYRERPPAESRENFRRLSQMRHVASFGILSMIFAVALTGPWLVEILFDDRYILAGGVVVLLSVYAMTQTVGVTYDMVALSAGDSRRHFAFTFVRALLQITFLFVGVSNFGLIGGLLGMSVAMIAAHPVLITLARKFNAWDPWHDVIWFSIVLAMATTAIWFNLEAVRTLTLM